MKAEPPIVAAGQGYAIEGAEVELGGVAVEARARGATHYQVARALGAGATGELIARREVVPPGRLSV